MATELAEWNGGMQALHIQSGDKDFVSGRGKTLDAHANPFEDLNNLNVSVSDFDCN